MNRAMLILPSGVCSGTLSDVRFSVIILFLKEEMFLNICFKPRLSLE